ncbi:sugar transferase [Enterococcus faecium]|uniref:sugar transferase n=1 Tax=Enterococcus faecium TaxID=1352 RepID=UPI00338DCDCA
MYKDFGKRIFDILLSMVLLIILLPVFCLISIAIKITSPGKIFFNQSRVGKNQKIFTIYKFRTMVTNAEQKGDGLFVFDEKDNRITAIGRFLRKTSLDEIPQLLNILFGEMSFVGPRPPVTYHPYEVGYYPDECLGRFDVKPGITGLAQVKLRNSVPWIDRIRLDVEYSKKVTFITDLKIFLETFLVVIKQKNVVISEEHKKSLK